MKKNSILFFADRLPPLAGGMEMHARYFIEHFCDHPRFPISSVITKNSEGQDCILGQENLLPLEMQDFSKLFNPMFLFFNSGRWIEQLEQFRKMFSDAIFFYRTGGNEILKAPLIYNQIVNHSLRQAYWVKTLNSTVDRMITNSSYTEKRLIDLGITCPFIRCVGGVNTSALASQLLSKPSKQPLTIFCAARFVPYKNHSLLLNVIRELILRGFQLKVRLAGEGPLLSQVKEQVNKDHLTSVVEFLGLLDNEKVCEEIVKADIYMQLSKDQVTEVQGGSYIHSEGMGRSILEALTAGTYIIAGNSGALSEIIATDRGILLDLGDFIQTVDTIEKVIKNLPVRLPYCNQYSWDNVFKVYESILESSI